MQFKSGNSCPKSLAIHLACTCCPRSSNQDLSFRADVPQRSINSKPERGHPATSQILQLVVFRWNINFKPSICHPIRCGNPLIFYSDLLKTHSNCFINLLRVLFFYNWSNEVLDVFFWNIWKLLLVKRNKKNKPPLPAIFQTPIHLFAYGKGTVPVIPCHHNW